MSIGRILASLVVFTAVAWCAGPPLTTIQDTIYKADGSRMNATAVISWKSFESSDTSDIGTQSVTVPIVNGNLFVQLVPNTTATPSVPYTVVYSSNGLVQFQESWMVPPSATPLRLRDVRAIAASTVVSGGGSGAIIGGGGVAGSVNEAGVTGLTADLAARPLKGAAFTPGRVAIVDQNGAIASVSGRFNDCVYVNGTSGPCFDPTQLPTYSDGETPSGVVDGANTSFALAARPVPSQSLVLFRNGILQKQGFDYNLSNSIVQFVAIGAPQPGDTLMAWYRAPAAATSGALSAPLVTAPSFGTASPQVVCSATGTRTSATAQTSLGSCSLPAGFLGAGDRVEIRYLFTHTGTASGFTYALSWGSTTLSQRVAGAADSSISGRSEAAIAATSTQITNESYGTALPFQTGFASSTVSTGSAININLQASLSTAGADTIELVNFTVIRYPATANP